MSVLWTSGARSVYQDVVGRNNKGAEYWKQNLRYLAILLAIWFLVSFGCGILWVEPLNQIRLGGFKLGFWFAQQGSIISFVILIVIYVNLMNRLDKRYGMAPQEDDPQ